MVQYLETKEPYVKVTDEVKRASIQSSTGSSLVIAAVIISDTGDTEPKLITSRSQFLENYSSEEITADYMAKLDNLYKSGKNMASTMFLNAYRLIGSNQMLICRASSSSGVNYSKELSPESTKSNKEYVVKDTEVLKKVSSATIKITEPNGWLISVDGVGSIGNLTSSGVPKYDHYVVTADALVKKLNETNKFFAPEGGYSISDNTITLTEAYIAKNFLDKSDDRTTSTDELSLLKEDTYSGLVGVELTGFEYSEEEPEYIAINKMNVSNDLKVNIKRYNHDYITGQDINGNYVVDNNIATEYNKNISLDRENDFYQFTITEGDISSVYTVGNNSSLGDMDLDEFTSLISSIQFVFPYKLSLLGLKYQGGTQEDSKIDLNIKVPDGSNILTVSKSAIEDAWDKILDNEIYDAEGFCDLGCTDLSIQNNIAVRAASYNAFYPISPTLSTNYLQIANNATKISDGVMPMNLYHIAPWDYDNGTVGFKFNCSPAVLYWETVAKNRNSNSEFAAVMGINTGIVSPINLAKTFTKTERQKLLSYKVNTIFNDIPNARSYINDNWTKQKEDDVMQEENNVRLKIRISKSMPKLLKQFIGRQSNLKLWNDIYDTIKYWMNTTIISMPYTISDYKIVCDDTNNTPEIIRARKVKVKLMVRYYNTAKYIEVLNQAYSIGIEFENV